MIEEIKKLGLNVSDLNKLVVFIGYVWAWEGYANDIRDGWFKDEESEDFLELIYILGTKYPKEQYQQILYDYNDEVWSAYIESLPKNPERDERVKAILARCNFGQLARKDKILKK